MPKLICIIDMDKEKGLILTTEDKDGKILQTVKMDGEAITLEVKGDSATSTIVQKQDSVTVTCKSFVLKAETIEVTSTKASSWKSDDTFALESAKAFTVTTKDELTQTATKDATLSSDKAVTMKAAKLFSVEGADVQLEAKSGVLSLNAPSVKAEGKKDIAMEGPQVKVTAKAQLALKADGMAEIKGGMVNVG
ncbi:hypothetical protein EJ065_3109 [Corallococcus coralloides]|uniref:Rhs element Vgr family protein n=1 Tax=Corallococcus coralloides TaxID=184914 RepID=A0A410RS21_CORCK|nr:hypothetical protein [Corallococcus coralloides]QAT84676.1 hypothetical protein EJ065_3109 [Corallococcus coralloides]